MKQTEALKAAQELFPAFAELLTLEQQHRVGMPFGYANHFYIFDHRGRGSTILASSSRSWEHALAIAKSGNKDIWPEQDEELDEVKDEVDHA